MDFDSHVAAVEGSGARLMELVEAAGSTVTVPTCPAWDAQALVAHLAMVHRWATAHVAGTDPDAVPNQTSLRGHPDLPTYYREGLATLAGALRSAPEDLEAMRFLYDAPPARQFWARRQAHETTIHMVDGLSARLGRFPTAVEAGVDAELAADGIDELLGGFLPRGRSRIYADADETVLFSATDTGDRWLVRIAEKNTTERNPADGTADLDVTGTAAELYLGLWNRGDEMDAPAEFVERWRSGQRVGWS